MTGEKIKAAFRATIPVLTGYLVLGMGFGIIMKANGYGLLWSAAMSFFIYAGSMQYAAVGLFTANAPLITVALTTLAVNARHLFYGVSMIEKYRNLGARRPYMILALTDETYSLVCSGRDADESFLISLLDHIYWVGGTVLGAVLGGALHFSTKGIDFALTALFITVFTDQWLSEKRHFPAVAGVAASVVCRLIFGAGSFLIPSMAAIAAILLLRMRQEARNDV